MIHHVHNSAFCSHLFRRTLLAAVLGVIPALMVTSLSAGELNQQARLNSINRDVETVTLHALRREHVEAEGSRRPYAKVLGTSVNYNEDGDTVVTINLSRAFFELHAAGDDLEEALHQLETEIGNIPSLETTEVRGGGLGFEILIEGIELQKYLPELSVDMEHKSRITTQAVSGTRIVISPGHGWYWNEGMKNWALQRSPFYGLVEDFVNSDITAYLKTELGSRGMDVRPTRELTKSSQVGETGHARWQEDARYYLRSVGAPTSVTNASSTDYNRDIMARPYYSNWVGAALMVSIHNNGAVTPGTATGTEVWYSNANGSVSESKKLAQFIHDRLLTVIRQYNPKWADRGVKFGNNYGENNYSTKPSALVELAFMDRKSPDNDALHDENFKSMAARAIRQGVEDYLGGRQQPDLRTQALSDMDKRAARDSRFSGHFTPGYGENLNWQPGWQLRWAAYAFTKGRTVYMYHATLISDSSQRYTQFFDPDRNAWTPWEQAQ